MRFRNCLDNLPQKRLLKPTSRHLAFQRKDNCKNPFDSFGLRGRVSGNLFTGVQKYMLSQLGMFASKKMLSPLKHVFGPVKQAISNRWRVENLFATGLCCLLR